MTFYFGKPAAGLVALPNPLRNITPTNDRAATVHTSSSGARQVDLAPRTRRTFTIGWAWLSPEVFSVLEEFYTGARGPGPFVLLDPGRRNHLTANQSGATSQTNDATGFVVAAGSGEFVASSSAPVLRGPRALRWSLPGTVVSGVLDLTPPFGLVAFPVPAGTPWTFSGQATAAGMAPSVTITPTLSWRRADGSELSITSGTPVAVGAGWSAWSVSVAAVPAGALYVCPQLRVAPGLLYAGAGGTDIADWASGPARFPMTAGPGPLTARNNRPLILAPAAPTAWGAGSVTVDRAPQVTTDVVLDQLQLEMFATPRAFALGTGMPQVSMTAFPETYQILPDRHLTATMVEVA